MAFSPIISVLILCCVVIIVQTYTLDKIIIAKNLHEPSVYRYNGIYYMTGKGEYSQTGAELYSSKNLQDWKFEKNLLYQDNFPRWSNANTVSSCEISPFGNSFNLYFAAVREKSLWSIGVATPSETGTYLDLGEPLLKGTPSGRFSQPNVAHEGMYDGIPV